MPRTTYSTEKNTMTKQVWGEVLYRVKYRNMAGQEYMHVPITSTQGMGR